MPGILSIAPDGRVPRPPPGARVGRARYERTWLVGPPGEEAAVVGPSGLRAAVHELLPGVDLTLPLHDGWRLLLVARGTVEVASPHLRTGLGALDAVLLPPGSPATVGVANEGRLIELLHDASGLEATALPAACSRSRRRRLHRPGWWRRTLLGPAAAMLLPRKLQLLVGPHHVRARFALEGPPDLGVLLAASPTGTGPAPHLQRLAWEILLPLQGRFEVGWGAQGGERVVVEPGDAVVVEPGVRRAWRHVAPGIGWVAEVVVGAHDPLGDRAWPPEVLPSRRRRLAPLAGIAVADDRSPAPPA